MLHLLLNKYIQTNWRHIISCNYSTRKN